MSYTQTTPVAFTLSCPPCKAAISGNNVPDDVVELFKAAHRHTASMRFVCYPCAEGMHSGCMRLPCECKCRENKNVGQDRGIRDGDA